MFKKFYLIIVLFSFLSESSFSQNHFVPFQDKPISYEGRIPYTKDAAELMWPGTSVRINFEGTGISGQCKDSDTSNYYNVIIDNNSICKIQFDTSKKIIVLAAGLPV